MLFSAYPDELPTFTDRLRETGYTTILVASNPLYLTAGLHRNGNDLVLATGVARGDVVNAAIRRALQLVPPSTPVFVMVHYMDVHQWLPWYYTPKHGEPISAERAEAVREAYRASVRTTDENLGELLELWDEAVDSPRSFVAFYSDHGESLFDGAGSGHDNSMVEVLLHVPLIIRYPKALSIDPGPVDEPAALIDLYPTLLHVLDLPPGRIPLDGRSLLESLDAQRPLYADYQLYGAELSSLRRGSGKLIVNLDTGDQQFESIGPGAGATERELDRLFRGYVEESKKRTAGLRSNTRIDAQAAADALSDLGYVESPGKETKQD